MDIEARRHEARRELLNLLTLPEDQLPLDRGVAWLTAEEQGLGGHEVESMVKQLDLLASDIHLRPGAPVYEHVARIGIKLFHSLGFRGDSDRYDTPESSWLDRVIQNRTGLPILLGVIYIEVARRVNLAVQGVGFPGHFLVSPTPDPGEPRFFVDPFHAGNILRREVLEQRLEILGGPDPDEAMKVVGHRYILMRISYNLKGLWMRSENYEAALRNVDRITILDPSRHEEWRDRGLLLARLGRYRDAEEDLNLYLKLRPGAIDEPVVEGVLEKLRRQSGE